MIEHPLKESSTKEERVLLTVDWLERRILPLRPCKMERLFRTGKAQFLAAEKFGISDDEWREVLAMLAL